MVALATGGKGQGSEGGAGMGCADADRRVRGSHVRLGVAPQRVSPFDYRSPSKLDETRPRSLSTDSYLLTSPSPILVNFKLPAETAVDYVAGSQAPLMVVHYVHGS